MKRLFGIFTLAMISAFVLMANPAKAQIDDEINTLYADYNEEGFEFLWTFTENVDEIENFTIWMMFHPEDYDYHTQVFEPLQVLNISDVEHSDNYFSYFMPMPVERGVYTFYITAENDNGLNMSTQILKIYLTDDWPNEKIRFKNYPTPEASVGNEYSHTVEAVYVDDEDAAIEYSIEDGPEGMTINSTTGEITWIPQEKGYTYMTIKAALADDSSIFSYQYVDLYVFQCGTLSTISGTINDTEGNPINSGYVIALERTEDDDGIEEPYGEYFSHVINGEFSFEIDGGSYDIIYYDNLVNSVEHPEGPFTIDCDESLELTMVVDIPEVNYYTVSGTVSFTDDRDLFDAVVVFEGNHPVYGIYTLETMVNEDGSYSIELPDAFEYKAYAMNFGDTFAPLMPLYYDQTYNPDNATLITLTGDLNGIDFVFGDNPDFQYYNVSGHVTDNNGDPIEGAMIFFRGFNDNPDRYYTDYFIEAITDESGYYSVSLPDDFKYISFAMYGDNAKPMLFYNQKTSVEDADIITLTEDRDDIDYIFDIENSDDNGIVRGYVVDENGEPITDVYLKAYNTSIDANSSFESYSTMINEDGYFSFNGLADGEYIIFAVSQFSNHLPGFYKENDVAVMDWEDATVLTVSDVDVPRIGTITITLGQMQATDYGAANPGTKASGIVTTRVSPDGQSKPITDASIYLIDELDQVTSFEMSKANGSFILNRLAEGSYTIKVQKLGYEDYTDVVNIDAGVNEIGNIELQKLLKTDINEGIVSPIQTAKVFPNPANDKATIYFKSHGEQTRIIISDMLGNVFYSETVDNISDSMSINVNTSKLPNGKYFVKINSAGYVSMTPLMIVR